ncbi:hypothetical protein I203_101121 [Kwoniella mangroviensis CBS 8507]|uniref:uncharacterized protein n=1 Tax=Kwoniella mangroviensis CBS 8507 TaxID=1296122 RepID=UPI00080D6B7D|nr:uncharacterized protein I203_02755 [Kwoniella mangroviensis CBS 8507]OCF68095.1 hypothetical protein I203_02755 [Kwoniella mangroviensis CBS 8507]
MKFISSFLALLTLLPTILAVTITGQIKFGDFPTRNILPVGSKVSINNGERKVWVKDDGSFEVPHIDEGEHILEPLIPGYIFQSYLITIHPSTMPPPPSQPSSPSSEDPSTPSSPTIPTYSIHIQPFYPAKAPLPISSTSLAHPLMITPLAREDYFTPKGGMNILGMLKSPMVLMMLFSAVMLFALPKLTASMADMDPEMAKEMAETREKMKGFQNMDLAGSLSNMLAGSTEDSPNSGTNTPNKSGSNSGSGGKKRRGR